MRSLDNIEKLIANSPNSQSFIQEQNKLKTKWEVFLMEETRGRQIRSGIKWIEEGEKCSKFFLGLEKTRAANNTIFELKDSDGKILKNEFDILDEISRYYSKIYKLDEGDEIDQFE